MESSGGEESPPLRQYDTDITDRDTVIKIADITLNHFKQIKRAAKRDDYSKVGDICHDIKEKIHKRNKCIKIGDKSPVGWDTVKEYLSDELASDSDDEKKIRSAETRTLRTKKHKEQERVKRWEWGYSSTRTASEDRQSTSTYSPYQYDKPVGPKPTDICFRCNIQGHWRLDCTKNNKPTLCN
ncbi:unnamed protein product [Mytilus coruscus]|uniref:CCHC-type domain-containing protein n=1 Tax=Mytilus coruscus TaxID=42192 RepID=A0A6J8EB29_MYTCO|nr:unnamed protein product [Mytilus coruscus]